MKLLNIIIVSSLLIYSDLYAAECFYVPKQSAHNMFPELSPQGECGVLINQDTFKVNEKHFKKLDFSDNGLTSIRYKKLIFYVSKSGKVVRTHFFDNGADYFSESMARTILNNKFGFIDKNLRIVIKPEYSFAFPFKSGVAIVCNDCKSISNGEHKEFIGGVWGVINNSGKIMIPLKYTKNKLIQSSEYKRITIR
jgi:hypothetical protein